MTDKYILAADEYIFNLPFDNVCENDLRILCNAFDKGNENVILCCEDTEKATACTLKFAVESNFSRVLYAEFDRYAYLFNDNMIRISVDSMLKESLCRPFVVSDFKEKRLDTDNYLLKFEDFADSKTLVIVDGFDIAAPTPYMRHLFAMPCKVLVVSRKHMNCDKAETVLFNGKAKEYNLDCLTHRQKELLMTLCAILSQLDSAIPVVSSEKGVFDKNSVRFYLGELATELESLETAGFVTTLPSGRIHIDRSLKRYVLDVLCPSPDNCKTFMAFTESMCSFRILQNVKDISATLYTDQDDYNSFAASLEFLCAYTHFAGADKRGGIKLYKMLLCLMLTFCSMQNGAVYTGHLLLRNADYYLSVVSEMIATPEFLEEIYDEELYMDDCLPDIYTYEILFLLDLVCLSLTFIRNMTVDMYKLHENVLCILLSSMDRIFDLYKECDYPDDMKAALLDDVIRLCSESFDHFAAIDEDGVYCHRHDTCDRGWVFYRGERETDRLYAESIKLGHSAITVKLYSAYCRFLAGWLSLCNENDVSHLNPLLKQLHEEKMSDRKRTLLSINAHFARMMNGFENFTDTYSKETLAKSIFDCIYDDAFEKRLQDNKRYLSRGFDGGTKRGAERYTDDIVNSLKQTENSLRVVLTVLSPDYPLSDFSYELLVEKELYKHILKNKNTTNHSLQILMETLICYYVLCVGKSGLRTLYEKLILTLDKSINKTEAFCERMYHIVSSMYVEIKKKKLPAGEDYCIEEFCNALYESYCENKKFKKMYCDDLIAKALHNKLEGKKIEIDALSLKKAFETHMCENMLSERDIDALKQLLL